MFEVQHRDTTTHSSEIWSAVWRKDKIATATVDGKVNIFSAADYKPLRTIDASPLAIVSLDIQGPLLATSGLDSRLKVFGVDTGDLLHTIDCSPVNTWKLFFQPHKEGVVATSGSSGGVTLHYLPKLIEADAKASSSVPAKDAKQKETAPAVQKPPLSLKTTSTAFTTAIAFSRDGYLLAVGDKDGVVSIFDLNPNGTGEPKLFKSFEAHLSPIRSMAFTNDAATLMTGADDATVGVFDVYPLSSVSPSREGRKIALLTGHAGPIQSVAVSNGSKFVASASFDKKVKVWTIADRECIITLHHHQGAVNCVDWDDKGEKLLSAGDDKSLILYKNIAQ